jgi:hypothetical protein
VDAGVPAADLAGLARLGDAAGDAVGHQLLVPLARVRPYDCGMRPSPS